MSVTDEYSIFVLDQLQCIGPAASKKMFGGAGIYCDEVFFALIAKDILYFKADDSNIQDYEQWDMKPFKPKGDDSYVMSYFEVPIDVLENEDELKLWGRKALDAAKNKAST